MIETAAAILLAAGRSLRFGSEDKLMSLFEGRPLIDHAAATLAALPFARRVAILRPQAPALRQRLRDHGFEVVVNERPEDGMGRSLALGIAEAAGADAALIALGDMPRVPAAHFVALLAALDTRGVAASLGLDRPTVPAAFARSRFDWLASRSGDEGARALLADAATVPIDPALLLDVDRTASWSDRGSRASTAASNA